MTTQDRFWSKVRQVGDDNVSSYWEWTAAKTRAGTENTYIYRGERRGCRTCRRAAARRYEAGRK